MTYICNIHIFLKLGKWMYQEAILGRIPSNDPQKGGLPVEKLTGCVIWTEEFKR
jgi:hypothetical protein